MGRFFARWSTLLCRRGNLLATVLLLALGAVPAHAAGTWREVQSGQAVLSGPWLPNHGFIKPDSKDPDTAIDPTTGKYYVLGRESWRDAQTGEAVASAPYIPDQGYIAPDPNNPKTALDAKTGKKYIFAADPGVTNTTPGQISPETGRNSVNTSFTLSIDHWNR
jgi:hypothetical protein